MNSIIEKILTDITKNKSKIFELSGTEREITQELFKLLKWEKYPKSYEGLFGQGSFKTDGCMTIKDEVVVFEVKSVKEKHKDVYEWGYWHALSQGLIYSYKQLHEPSEKDFLVLCIIFDWGRAAGRELDEDDRGFLDQFRKDRIRFLRVSMSNKKFIEHNMEKSRDSHLWKKVGIGTNGMKIRYRFSC